METHFCDRLRSSAIVCDRLRSCDHMETKVLRSAIETYPIIILILTQMIQNFLATKPECSFMFVTVLSETRSSLSSVWKAPSFCLFMNIFRTQNRCFLRFWSWRCRRFRTKRRSKFGCCKISSSMSAMLFAKEILPRAQRACTFDISADRNVWLQPALRSFAIVCDYMETALFAIVCDLRFAIRDRLRSSAIIWKPALRLWVLKPLAVTPMADKISLINSQTS